jgi:hypothetical protein
VATVAEADAVPLDTVTTAAITPTLLGASSVKVTVNVVAVDAVTRPTAVAPAAGVNATTLFPGVDASKPVPAIVRVAKLEAKSLVSAVITGAAEGKREEPPEKA